MGVNYLEKSPSQLFTKLRHSQEFEIDFFNREGKMVYSNPAFFSATLILLLMCKAKV